MRPEQAARTLAIIGTVLLILAALVRVLAAYLITIDMRFLPNSGAVITDRNPVMGLYTLSPDRRRVSFSRGVTVPTGDGENNIWAGNSYSLDLDNGSITSGAPNREMAYFTIRNNELVILDNRLRQTLSGRQMAVFAVSDTGRELAFAEPAASGRWFLYAVRGLSEPEELLQEIYFTDLSWSPDGERLLYVAPRRASDEVFQYNFDTGEAVQLTQDGTRKRGPVFSMDRTQVAFLAVVGEEDSPTLGQKTPTPLTLPPLNAASGRNNTNSDPEAARTEVFVIGSDGGEPVRLTDNDLEEFDLKWTSSGQVLFSVWRSEWPMVSWLYGVDPDSREVKRIHPALAVDELSCTPDLLGANRAVVKLMVSNTSMQALDFPLEISMDRLPLDVVTARSQFRVEREVMRLNAGESRQLEYTVPVVNDQKAFLAATIETGVEFPVAAAFCEVELRTLLLPRLRWLGATLGMVLFGCLLSIPWLRHQKNRWLWRLWLLFLALLVVLMGFESAAIFGLLG